VADKKSARTIL